MHQPTPVGSLTQRETHLGPFVAGLIAVDPFSFGAFIFSAKKRCEPEPIWELGLVPFMRSSWRITEPVLVRVGPNHEFYSLCEERRVLNCPIEFYPEPEKTLAAARCWDTRSYRDGLMIGAVSCLSVLEAMKPCVIGYDTDGILERNLRPLTPTNGTPDDDPTWAFYHGFQIAMIAFRLLPEGEIYANGNADRLQSLTANVILLP